MSCVIALKRLKGPETNKKILEGISKKASSHLDRTAKRNNDNCKMPSFPTMENVYSNSENSCSGSLQSFDFNEEDTNADASATDEEIEMKCEQEHSFDIIMEDNVTFITSDQKLSQVAN